MILRLRDWLREYADADYARARNDLFELQMERDVARHALIEAKRKLNAYRAAHGNGPVSGMEFGALIRKIDEALK